MEFLREDGSWTQDVSKAKSFPHVTAVFEERDRLGLKNVEFYRLQREHFSSLDFSWPMG